MIIGNGMMAQRFFDLYQHDERTLIFASGVSNSLENSSSAFQREEKMLMDCIRTHKEKTLVYFGTCSIFDPSLCHSMYIAHKLKMEEIVRNEASKYLFCRTTNIVGRIGNPSTLINFLFNKIRSGQHFDLWIHSVRNILDIDDLYNAVHKLLQHPQSPKETVNIACPFSYSVPEIVDTLEWHLQRKGLYRAIEKGSDYSIPDILEWPGDAERRILSKEYYLKNVMMKYHPVFEAVL